MESRSESWDLSHARRDSPECWSCIFAESFDAFKAEMIGLNKTQTAEINGKIETIASEIRLHRWFFLAFLG